MLTTTEKLQLIKQIPSVIELQTRLLQQWCDNHGWTDLYLGSDQQFYASPPGSLLVSLLPELALRQLEELDRIVHELGVLQLRKEVAQETTKATISSSISCASLIIIYVLLKEDLDILSQGVIIYYIFAFLAILLLILIITFSITTLVDWLKYHRLKSQITKKLTSEPLNYLKDINEGTFIVFINLI